MHSHSGHLPVERRGATSAMHTARECIYAWLSAQRAPPPPAGVPVGQRTPCRHPRATPCAGDDGGAVYYTDAIHWMRTMETYLEAHMQMRRTPPHLMRWFEPIQLVAIHSALGSQHDPSGVDRSSMHICCHSLTIIPACQRACAHHANTKTNEIKDKPSAIKLGPSILNRDG